MDKRILNLPGRGGGGVGVGHIQRIMNHNGAKFLSIWKVKIMEQCLQHSKENDFQPKIIYFDKVSVECEGRLKTILDMEGVKNFTSIHHI